MSPEQFLQLLEFIEKLSNRPFAISNAADWPIIVIGGSVIISLVALMWRDLRTAVNYSLKELSTSIKEYRAESKKELDEFKKENDKEHEALKAEIDELKKDR